MKVLIFGATGMTGQSVLHACLDAPDVAQVTVVVRKPIGVRHPKLQEIVLAEMVGIAALRDQLRGFDACLYCLGLTTTRASEAAYARVTHDILVAVAGVLAELSPDLRFVYLSGPRPREGSRMMQPKVRALAEAALRGMPWREAPVILRPEMIVPVGGARPRTPALRLFYATMKPLLFGLRLIAPHHIATTAQIAQVMLAVARKRPATSELDGAAIAALTPSGK